MPRPTQAFASPIWWTALALLVLNDHFLKGGGVLPQAFTGKLSDFVGLLVAPAILAALVSLLQPNALSRRAWWACHAAVGLGFAAINLSPAFATAVETATASTWFPWIIAVDPTDLVALPMLGVSACVFSPPARSDIARPLRGLTLVAGGLACAATSPPPCGSADNPCPPPPEPPPFSQTIDLRIGMANQTDAPLIVRVRRANAGLDYDCQHLADNPTGHLRRAHFGTPVMWEIPPQSVSPIHTGSHDDGYDRGCRFYWIDSDRFSPVVVFAMDGDAPLTNVSFEAPGLGDFEPQVMRFAGDITLPGHPMAFPTSAAPLPDPADEGCTESEPTTLPTWSEPVPTGTFSVSDVRGDADTCWGLDLATAAGELPTFWLCLAGVDVDLGELIDSPQVSLNLTGQNRLTLSSPDLEVDVLRGAQQLGTLIDPDVAIQFGTDCGSAYDACFNQNAALTAHYFDGEGAYVPLGPAPLTFQSADRSIHLLRAVKVLTANPCEATDTPMALGQHLDAVAVSRVPNSNDANDSTPPTPGETP